MSETHQTIGREEEADAMLRHTRFSWGVKPFIVLAFLGSVAAVPAVQWFAVKNDPKLQRQLEKSAGPLLESGGVPQAEDLHGFEKSLERNSVVFSQIRPYTQTFLTQVLREGNEQVCVGQGGWLFYRKGVNHLAGEGFLDPQLLDRRRKAGTDQPDPVAGILRFKRQLAKRGIALAVMPVPDKASIYPEKLAPNRAVSAEPPRNVSFFEFKRRLEEKGVLVYDPTQALMDAKRRLDAPQWFAGDSHWTPIAGQVAARGLADAIDAAGLLPARLTINYTRRQITGTDPGDMVRLLGLLKDQKLFRPSISPATQVRLPNGKQCEPDPKADVLLLGDSFSGAYRYAGAGLVQQLSYYLKRPVDHVGVPNGGSWGARLKLANQMWAGNDRLAGKKLVIYEFVARDLSFGNWKSIDMPMPKRRAKIRRQAS